MESVLQAGEMGFLSRASISEREEQEPGAPHQGNLGGGVQHPALCGPLPGGSLRQPANQSPHPSSFVLAFPFGKFSQHV